MKNLVYIIAICVGLLGCTSEVVNEEVIVVEQGPTSTSLTMVNSTKDSVLIYLTLSGYPASDTVPIKDVYGIFGITDHGLVGSFYLGANDSVSYTSSKWFSGNVGFGAQPINCFTQAWPTGTNPFEFNLNNNQESIDISSIAGVNCIMNVELIGGPKWQASPAYPDVKFFYNDSMYKNTGLIGVFPYGCTNCVDTAGKQSCQTPAETPSQHHICNPTRAAGEHGGTVLINFKGYTNYQICK